MDAPSKNDILASNLLFGVLAITFVERLIDASRLGFYVHIPGQPTSITTALAVWLPLLLGMALAGGCYYAVRKGQLWAKLLVVAAFLWTLYITTSLQDGILVGVSLKHLLGWALVTWVKTALTLTALVLMFKRSRVVAPSGT
jgi:hypothetical protein